MSTINAPTPDFGSDGTGIPSNGMARICKALGHPIRMQIVSILMTEGQCFCGQLVKRLPLAQSTVSQHLKFLKDTGIITGEIDGPGTAYCLNRKLLRQFSKSLARFFEE